MRKGEKEKKKGEEEEEIMILNFEVKENHTLVNFVDRNKEVEGEKNGLNFSFKNKNFLSFFLNFLIYFLISFSRFFKLKCQK